MKTCPDAWHRRNLPSGDRFKFRTVLIFCSLFLGLLTLTARLGAGPMIDLNTNSMSDVWEQVYGAASFAAGNDNDGDGFSNSKEAAAGTSPVNGNLFPKISTSTLAGPAFNVALACELGKQYQLQSVTELGSTNWVVETNLVVRSGTTLTLSSPAGSAGKYFRTAVSDVDTDGDGVSDWEEYKLGLNPLNPTSNNQLDSGGQLMSDQAYATGKFAAQNIFSVTATDPIAVQPEPGTNQPVNDAGTLTISRGGFPLRALTVTMTLGTGAGFATEGVDHTPLLRSISFPVGVSSQNISVTPKANTNLHTSVLAMMKLLTGANYTLSQASNASVVIYPSMTNSGTGLSGNYYTNSSATYTNANNFNTNKLILSRVDPVIDFTYTNGPTPNLSNGLYSVRWTGQVQPQYSETYYFAVRSDDGCKLWVNDQLIIDRWQTQSAAEVVNTIALQGGTRYNLKLEYLQNGGAGAVRLSWYSASQPKQVIPSNRLYPTNAPASPSSVTSPLWAVGFLGQPFSFNVTGANSPTNFTAIGLPPGLAFTPTNGLISGVPNLAGNYQGVAREHPGH
jgi:hypothetical protein